MTINSPYWRRCNSCKKEIGFKERYYACSVSTCNQQRTGLVFCSVSCWDMHLPFARHRNASAVEKRSPGFAEWERQKSEEVPVNSNSSSPSQPLPCNTPRESQPITKVNLHEVTQPHDILVVVSKLKKYVRERSGMNTSDSVMKVLSDRLRALCDEGIHNSAKAGRKTLMDRDFKSILD